MSSSSSLSWSEAKETTRKQIAALPEYTSEDVLNTYKELLVELAKDNIKCLNPAARAFAMQRQFPQFSIAYSGLFNLACRRDTPPDLQQIAALIAIAEKQKAGQVDEAKARGMCMDVAESCRRAKSAI